LRQTIIMQALSDVAVKDVMTQKVIAISPEKTVFEAEAEYFRVYMHGGFPVVTEDKIVGIVTVGDTKKVPEQEKNIKTVAEIMTSRERLIFVKPHESVADAFLKFSKNEIGRLPVLSEEKVVGIVTRSDVFRTVRFRTQQEVGVGS